MGVCGTLDVVIVRGQIYQRSKRGKLKSGRFGKTVKSRAQAIAIGLSEARKRGAKVPRLGPVTNHASAGVEHNTNHEHRV